MQLLICLKSFGTMSQFKSGIFKSFMKQPEECDVMPGLWPQSLSQPARSGRGREATGAFCARGYSLKVAGRKGPARASSPAVSGVPLRGPGDTAPRAKRALSLGERLLWGRVLIWSFCLSLNKRVGS